MSINFELLDQRAFAAVFDDASFNKAAELLNRSQGRALTPDARVGVPLLEHSTRHVVPTSAGRRVELKGRWLLDEFDTSLLSISGIGERETGQITIASIPTAVIYFCLGVIKSFNQRYPHMSRHPSFEEDR